MGGPVWSPAVNGTAHTDPPIGWRASLRGGAAPDGGRPHRAAPTERGDCLLLRQQKPPTMLAPFPSRRYSIPCGSLSTVAPPPDHRTDAPRCIMSTALG